MPEIVFLEAADQTPLTKAFIYRDGDIESRPYPEVREFISHHHEIHSIHELHLAKVAHAELGHCLLRGRLTHPLKRESRAGAHLRDAPTRWIELDLDFETQDGADWPDVDAFLATLGLDGVTYSFTHSASAGIRAAARLRGHVEMWLASAWTPAQLKLLVRGWNLTIPQLTRRIELAASGHALRYPLDVTVNQADKLVYIAPPICVGFDDPLVGSRHRLVERDRHELDLSATLVPPDQLRNLEDALKNELREAKGLRRVKAKYEHVGEQEVLVNPDRAQVTGEKIGDQFTRVNLNGGDSWAYWYHNDSPELLLNFKGEPTVRLKDIDPTYYKSVLMRRRAEAQATLAEEDKELHRFAAKRYDMDEYVGIRVFPRRIEVIPHGVRSLKDFLGVVGEEVPDPVPEWQVRWDPATPELLNAQEQWVNTFEFTPAMHLEPVPGSTVPPVIDRILWSLCGERTFYDWFLNWLAVIFQRRTRTSTAVVFRGTQGTGKGVLGSYVLEYLFGRAYSPVTVSTILDNFNPYVGRRLMLFVDEVKVDPRDMDRFTNTVKNMITEPVVMVRDLYRSPVPMQNRVNVIVATNHADPFRVELGDRRFSVAPPQIHRLELTDAEFRQMLGERPAFAQFLLAYPADEMRAMVPLENASKAQLQSYTASDLEILLEAIRVGDLDYFVQLMTTSGSYSDVAQRLYDDRVRAWHATLGKEMALTLTDLKQVVTHLTANPRISLQALMNRAKRAGLLVGPMLVNGVMTQAVPVQWRCTQGTLPGRVDELAVQRSTAFHVHPRVGGTQ